MDFSKLSDAELQKLYAQPQVSPLAGMSDDDLRAAYGQMKPATQSLSGGDVVADVAKSGGAGLAKGGIGLAGMIDDVSELGARGLNKATQYIGGKMGYDIAPRADQTPKFGSAAIQSAVEGVTGEFYKPKTTAGEYAHTVGEFAPGMIGGHAGLGRRALTQVLAPGLASEAGGQLTKGTAAEPYARVAGALAGSVVPSAVSRAITPLPINAERAAAVNTLRNEGVTDLTAGQVTGRKPLQYLEAERGQGANLVESQAEQFTSAALRRVGVDANRATPEVIDTAFTRIGQQFDDLAARNTLKTDNQLVQDLGNVVTDYAGLVPNSMRAPIVKNVVDDIVTSATQQAARGQGIGGEAYQALRSRLEKAARSAGSDPQLAEALRGIRTSLDDAMERSIQASGNHADLGAWRDARNKYRNMLVIEQAATGAGEGAAAGLISPAKLREATVSKQGRRNYARGNGDFSDLARSGVQTMSPLPNSGTPGRISAQNLGMGVSSLLGGGAAYSAGGGDPTTAAAGAVVGALLPRGIGRAATSRAGRAYLGNQVAAPMLNNLTPQQTAIINALMAGRQQQLLEPPR
jgi:hypothetical protein